MYQFKNWKLICEEKDREIARLKEELERVKRMERLTERELNSLGGVYYGECHFTDCDGNCKDCEVQYKADLKLKEYEDLDEQGLLLKLPCKVGDVVFIVSQHLDVNTLEQSHKILERRIHSTRGNRLNPLIYITTNEDGSERNFTPSAIGKRVFLTKAEAEKALAEMEK